MSDPVNKPRQPVDLDEFERRLRGGEPSFSSGPAFVVPDPYAAQAPYEPQMQMPAPTQQSYVGQQNDPLAELARIVDGPRTNPYGTRHEPTLPRATPLTGGWDAQQPEDLHPDLRGGGYGGQELPPFQSSRMQSEPQYAGSSWPADNDGWDATEEAPPRRSSKKFLLMGAAALVVVGGIGATFVTRGGSSGKSDVPTIKAQSGPMKVTPEPTPSANASEPARNASVLERGNTEKLNASRVVNNEEQPVDLSQVKSSGLPPATASSGSSAPAAAGNRPAGVFPEPIKVKTVSVRPDGTIVTAVTTPAPAAAPTSLAPAAPPPRQVSTTPTGSTPAPAPSQRAAAPAAAPAPAPVASAPAPSPAPTPKSTERATSTPLPVAGSGSSTSSDLPRQLASAQPAPPPAPSPAASSSGGFAVQFSAAASEQEAREKIAATQRRFADALGGRTPTFIKGEAGSRIVWRVRVGGMSREEASTMCQRIKGQGGDCFVAAN